MKITARSVTEADLPLLAEMNRRLIEDEGSKNPMTMAELQQRMRAWWMEGRSLRLFLDEDEQSVVGYAVFYLRSEEYFPDKKHIYLRQMYVERAQRNQGIGQQALKWLIKNEFPAGCKVIIDVLASNPRGLAFWQRMGFAPNYTNMRLDPGQ
jgi:GNAT superfamily N-acetyltransferase